MQENSETFGKSLFYIWEWPILGAELFEELGAKWDTLLLMLMRIKQNNEKREARSDQNTPKHPDDQAFFGIFLV